jgi:hypothetical protein
VAFAADDLAAWLIGLLADAGRKKLIGLVLGSDLERALSSAATEAVWRTADLTHLQLRENRAGSSADGQPPVFVTANVSSTLYRSDDWVVDVPLGQLAHWNASSPPIYKGGLGMWAFLLAPP